MPLRDALDGVAVSRESVSWKVIATPSKIVIDPAAKQDIQKRLHKLLNVLAIMATF